MNRQDIEAFVDIAPPYGTETHGETVRMALVNRLMGALPGHAVENRAGWAQQGIAWCKFFFPDYKTGPLYENVGPLTGLDDGFFSGFSTALLCASIRQVAHEAVKLVDSEKLDPALASYNGQLRDGVRLVQLYAHVLSRDWEPLTSVLANAERASACAIVLERLACESWRAKRWDLLESGDWVNFDWDIFHYWVKLLALGADQSMIDRAAADLATAFAIPSTVSAGRWPSYFQWMRPPSDPLHKAEITHAEFSQQAARSILTTRVTTSLPRGRSPGAQHETAEGYASSFMMKSQPGDSYRVVQQHSCFGIGTPVLMADGSLCPIEDIAPGDQVATPSGPADVALLVRTPRAGRSLWRINGGRAAFTEAHPLLAATLPGSEGGYPAFMTVSPTQLGQSIPTLSWLGVDQLAPGARLLGWKGQGPSTVTVVNLQAEHGGEPDESVYDMVVWPDPQSDCQYIVCNGQEYLVAAAELPLLSKAPLAMQVILALIERLADSLERVDQPEKLTAFLSVAVNDALPRALHQASRMTGATTATDSERGLARTFERLRASGEYNASFGRAVAMLIESLGPAVDNAISLGFRYIALPRQQQRDTPIVALSLHDIAFRKWARAEFSKTVEVAISLRTKAFSISPARIGPHAGDFPFLRKLNGLAYLDLSQEQAMSPIESLHFDIIIDGHVAFFGRAQVDLATALPLRRYSVRLMNAAHKPAGRLSFDLRYLSAAARAEEEAARPGWNPSAMGAFTQYLSTTLADEASSLFAAMHGVAGTQWEGIQ